MLLISLTPAGFHFFSTANAEAVSIPKTVHSFVLGQVAGLAWRGFVLLCVLVCFLGIRTMSLACAVLGGGKRQFGDAQVMHVALETLVRHCSSEHLCERLIRGICLTPPG